MNLTKGFSRRELLAHTSCFGAFCALAMPGGFAIGPAIAKLYSEWQASKP